MIKCEVEMEERERGEEESSKSRQTGKERETMIAN
jgi:hypothetical protein